MPSRLPETEGGAERGAGTRDPILPDYRGLEWIDAALPSRAEPWLRIGRRFFTVPGTDDCAASREEVQRYLERKPWVWPSREIFFFCDLHADADAFLASLVASGGVQKTGPGDDDFVLTPEGAEAVFIIGGDCFDKGPDTLRLLRAIRSLRDRGADVVILAGNHDVRTWTGIVCAGSKDPLLAHLFVRMGKKTIPLFKQIWDEYLSDGEPELLCDERVKELLFPGDRWFDEFPCMAEGRIRPKRLAKELVRIREKMVELEAKCHEVGLGLGQLHAALERASELFTKPHGEFHWFFRDMKLAARAGSFLFIHGGVDDTLAQALQAGGVESLNDRFQHLFAGDLFELYHGAFGNAFRTKYRDTDYPLSAQGVVSLHGAGIYAIVHGHRNIRQGQRAVMRCGVLNFECDASVDRNTRAVEELEGPGAAVTVFRTDGRVLGISTDHPSVKVFDPAAVSGVMTIV